MKRLREFLEQLQLHFQVEIAIADVLDTHDKRLDDIDKYKLKTDTRLTSLDKRYSELLMVLRDINRKLPDSVK